MDWLAWIFVILAALLFLAVLFYGVQARRRRGGVVAQKAGRRS
jgi:formate hydrogenlyase subunit 3/multisubunit Na+/H+ antiporter MnhD subunit